jgi:hypothetical protein
LLVVVVKSGLTISFIKSRLHRELVSEWAIARLNNGKVVLVLLSAQAIGIVFYVVFLLAYCLALPSTDNLIGDSTIRLILQVSGGLFLFLVVSSLVALVAAGKRE